MKSFFCKKKSNGFTTDLIEIKKEIKMAMKKRTKQTSFELLAKDELLLINRVKEKTSKLNVNNVTRTNAYFDFYCRFPNIHWAFLGHMVSRNGGWSMTDLKGDLLSRLLSKQEQIDFFSFLERGNWLIFQDVYPQFLIYEESIKSQKNLFHLLSYFDVSVFMEGIWNRYLKKGGDKRLAIALVINEQSYLENRVIRNPTYLKNVILSFEFQLQDLLSLNPVLFPYVKNETEIGLVGESIRYFAFLHERIALGKRLYSLLFEQEMLEKVFLWAKKHPHTGSRKDFFPHLFNNVKELPPNKKYKQKMKDCVLKKNSTHLYSPILNEAWDNVIHDEAERGDWFHDFKSINELLDNEEKGTGEIQHEYCEILEKLELAILAKEILFYKEA